MVLFIWGSFFFIAGGDIEETEQMCKHSIAITGKIEKWIIIIFFYDKKKNVILCVCAFMYHEVIICHMICIDNT